MSEDALAKIKAEIERKRVRVQELFSDFDPLRTGYVSRYQFIRYGMPIVIIIIFIFA
jgi:hypothetical protein